MLRLFYVFLFFKGKGGNGKDNPQWDSVGERCMTDGNRRGKAGLFLLPVVGVGTVLAQEIHPRSSAGFFLLQVTICFI